MEVQKKIEKTVVPANVEDLIASGEIVQLKQVDGSTECNIKVQNEKPWRPKEKLQVVHFILPYGYDKCAFFMDIRGNMCDLVEARWASLHHDDASILVHTKTSRCLKNNDGVEARVHNVYGIRKR